MARPTRVLFALLLALAAQASAADTARDLRDQALADLRALQASTPTAPLAQHLADAVRVLAASPDPFVGPDQVAGESAFDALRQGVEATTRAADQALRAPSVPLADRLQADASRLATAARRVAQALLGESAAWLLVADPAAARAPSSRAAAWSRSQPRSCGMDATQAGKWWPTARTPTGSRAPGCQRADLRSR